MRAPQVVLVAYRSPLWLKVAVGSFLARFPDQQILVVDNNPRPGERGWHPACEEERQWLAAHPGVRLLPNDGDDRTHGAGMDLALAWCREHGVEAMLHIETDCYVSGVDWYRHLTEAIDRGAWMAACHRKAWGPLHPCPSIWKVDEVRAGFRRHDGAEDVRHPRFAELFDIEAYRRELGLDVRTDEWSWDTGLKAWFDAALVDRAVQVPKSGFAHYWRGSINRQEHPHLFLDPRLLRYSRPSVRQWTRVVAAALATRLGRRSGAA